MFRATEAALQIRFLIQEKTLHPEYEPEHAKIASAAQKRCNFFSFFNFPLAVLTGVWYHDGHAALLHCEHTVRKGGSNMSNVKDFLRRKDIVITPQRYLIEALGAMAQGLFASLLIGTIIKTLGQQTGLDVLVDIYLHLCKRFFDFFCFSYCISKSNVV